MPSLQPTPLRRMIGIAAPARSGKDTVARLLLQQTGTVAYALADPLKNGCQVLFGLSDQETWSDSLKETTIPLWQRSPREFFQQAGTDWMRAFNPDHWLMRTERMISPSLSPANAVFHPRLDHDFCHFQLAAQAFFGLSDWQTWSPDAHCIVDPFWELSPASMFALIERLTLRDYPHYWSIRRQRPTQAPSRHLPVLNASEVIIIKDIRFENEAAYLRAHQGRIWHVVRHNAEKVNAHSSEHGIRIAEDDLVIDNNGSLQDLAETVQAAWLQHQRGQSAD